MLKDKRSFFEKLTGTINVDEEEFDDVREISSENEDDEDWIEKENEEGQLMVDVYQTPTEIVIQAMVAGVPSEELNVSITRELVTLSGKRESQQNITKEDYFYKELYWGSFSRTILLPHEIEPDESTAEEHHGLLTLRLPKIDKEKTKKVKVKSI